MFKAKYDERMIEVLELKKQNQARRVLNLRKIDHGLLTAKGEEISRRRNAPASSSFEPIGQATRSSGFSAAVSGP